MEYKIISLIMKALILVLTIFACSSLALDIPFLSDPDVDPLVPVPVLDLAKYGGVWYEIGRIPYLFELKCQCNIANYSLNDDGTVGVLNICNWDAPDGKLVSQQGKAYAEDPVNGTITTGKLDVEFFGFVNAPYYVIDIDDDYQNALVGSPNRKYLWILARTPTIDDDLYNELIQKAVADEFDVSSFIKTYQGDDCPQY